MKTEIVTVKKSGINGEGIAYINRNIVFIPGCFVDEEVEIEIAKDTPTYKLGKLVNVITPSKYRIKSSCRQNKNCLGCPYIELDYKKQLEAKKELIVESVRKYANVKNVPAIDIVGCENIYNTQNSFQLPVAYFNDRIYLGIYQRDTKYFTIMNECSRYDKILLKVIKDLEEILNKNKVKDYNDKFKKGLRFASGRVFEGKVQLSLITGVDKLSGKVLEEIANIDNVVSLHLSVNTTKRQEFNEGRFEKVSGLSRLEFIDKDHKFVIAPTSKFNTNTKQAFSISKAMKNMLNGQHDLNAIVLNSGIGYISINISEYCKKVVGIESSRSDLDDANNNVKIARLDNITFEKGEAEEMLPPLTKKNEFDLIVINQLDGALSDDIVDSIIKGKIKTIIYMNKTVTAATKDVGLLTKYYNIEQIVGFDVVPMSPNLSCVIKLVRK